MKRNTAIVLAVVTLICLVVGGSFAGVQSTRTLENILGNLAIYDDYKLYFGTGSDASIEYDEDGTDQLRISGSTIFEDAVEFDGALSFDGGYAVPDDVAITFGTGLDGSIEYDEDGTDQMRFAGASIFEDAIEFDGALDVDSTVALGGVMTVADDTTVVFGADADASIEYDEDGTDQLRFTGASIFASAIEFDGALDIDSTVALGGVMTVADDIALTLGSDADATIMYDETTDDALEITSTNITLDGAIAATGAVGLAAGGQVPDEIKLVFGTDGDSELYYDEASDDAFTIDSTYINLKGDVAIIEGLSISAAAAIADDTTLSFGNDSDATITYDETTDDALEITCTNITLTGAIGATGAITGTSTITSSAAGSLGWSIVAGANTACNTTCTNACVAGQDADAANVLVACDSAAADVCICAGAN